MECGEFDIIVGLERVKRGQQIPADLYTALQSDGYLNEDGGLTREGKAAVMLFNDELASVLKDFDVYKDVVCADGVTRDMRIPLYTFVMSRAKNSLPTTIFPLAVYWEEYFTSNNDRDIESFVKTKLEDNHWTTLSKNVFETARMCQLLLNPMYNPRTLVKIKHV